MKLKKVLQNLNEAVAKEPMLLELDCFFTDDQCCHYEMSGHVFQEITEEWPDEYCISEATDAKTFVRIC